jgi:hypothetical protein
MSATSFSSSSAATIALPNTTAAITTLSNGATFTLTSSQTALPTLIGNHHCGVETPTPNTTNLACAIPPSDYGASVLLSCCGAAPRVFDSNSCNMYCEAWNQTLQELNQCIQSKSISNNTLLITSIVCNAVGSAFSTSVRTIFNTSTATGSSPISTSHSGSGSSVNGRHSDGWSKGAWATVVILLGGFAMGIGI